MIDGFSSSMIVKSSRYFSSSSTKNCGIGCACAGSDLRRRRSHFGHEIEVEEFNEFHLDLASCTAVLEQTSDNQETIKCFECSRVRRIVQERGHQSEEGGRMDCWTGLGIQEIEKELRMSVCDREDLEGLGLGLTFICISLANSSRDGGCSNSTP